MARGTLNASCTRRVLTLASPCPPATNTHTQHSAVSGRGERATRSGEAAPGARGRCEPPRERRTDAVTRSGGMRAGAGDRTAVVSGSFIRARSCLSGGGLRVLNAHNRTTRAQNETGAFSKFTIRFFWRFDSKLLPRQVVFFCLFYVSPRIADCL